MAKVYMNTKHDYQCTLTVNPFDHHLAIVTHIKEVSKHSQNVLNFASWINSH